jgi:hypothetical protein
MPCGLCGRHGNRLVRFDGDRDILNESFCRMNAPCAWLLARTAKSMLIYELGYGEVGYYDI